MRLWSKILVALSFGAIGTACLAQAPKGKLTYCSYSRTGAAGLGKDYCELIAEPGQTPKVVVALDLGNRFGKPETHAEYQVGEDVVEKLSKMLSDAKVYKLNGYSVDEHISGGHSYRIYQEYDSGEKINARWYGHNIKQEALSAYHMIESFFRPWRTQAIQENDPVVQFELSAKRVAGRGTDYFTLLAQNGFRPRVIYDLNVESSLKEEVHEQFNLESEEDIQKVKQLQADLIALGSSSLGDYTKDDFLEGGTIYTVKLTYGSGAKQTLYWHSHDVDPKAQAVYDRIRSFFRQWVK
ncbi:MAG: hypothetical protein J6S97_08500 [Bacteroidales bacterium]|nr:hypothetical protein [Bacteroidales bacterium]